MKTTRPLLTLFACLPMFAACSSPRVETVKVVLEEGAYHTASHVKTADKGSDFTFVITLDVTSAVIGCSYANYSIQETISGDSRRDEITFHKVEYSTVITLEIAAATVIHYEGNGVSKDEYPLLTHLRVNTSTDYDTFAKDGYCLAGWKKGGEVISIGSRVDVGTSPALEAFYLKESDTSLFDYVLSDSSRAAITGYHGNESTVVLPEKIEGRYLTEIRSGAFASCAIDTLVLPKSLSMVAEGAFSSCQINELVFFDRLSNVSDSSFIDTSIAAIRINAARNPCYIRSYYGSYGDKLDRLMAMKDERKIVLYSGSSTRFGFDSELIDKTFLDYEVVNMGVIAYSSSLPQIDILADFIQHGDIVIASPEFDTIETQVDLQKTIDPHLFKMVESNYDALRYLNVNEYTGFFDSFASYQYDRAHMEAVSYQDTPSDYDEDGNRVNTPSYNRYGDYSLYRENNEARKNFGIKRAYYNKDYFTEEALTRFDEGYDLLRNAGATLYYDYSPRMSTSLSEDSTAETVDALDEYLKKNVDMTFLSSAEESLMDPLYFFGTDNHLSTEGVDIRTSRVIARLLDQLDV